MVLKREDTLCKQCENCETHVYERWDKKNNLQMFLYCNGNKDLVKLSNWYIQKDGYAYSTSPINGKKTFFHRLCMEHSYLTCDHVNGNRMDNRLCKLREVTQMEQNQNYHKMKRTSKFPGVWWNRKREKWICSCRLNGRNTRAEFLGYYDTELEAFHQYILYLKEQGRIINKTTPQYEEYVEWLKDAPQSSLDKYVPARKEAGKGHKHVYYDKSSNKYRVSKCINGKTYNFGTYTTIEEAREKVKELMSNHWEGKDASHNDYYRYIELGKRSKWKYIVHKFLDDGFEFKEFYNDLREALNDRDFFEECNWDLDAMSDNYDTRGNKYVDIELPSVPKRLRL